jgi:hypothetical protein
VGEREARWGDLLGLPGMRRWAARPRKDGRAREGQLGRPRLGPREREKVFDLFHFVKLFWS